MLKSLIQKLKKYWEKFSYTGLFFGTLFFVASLTPSLLPRTSLFQGALSGIVFAFGYGMGCFVLWFWRYLELPEIPIFKKKNSPKIIGVLIAFFIIFGLGRSITWQNSILEVMDQELVKNSDPLFIGLVALITAILFIGLGRLIKCGFGFSMKKIYKLIPRKIANVIGFAIALFFFIIILNGFFGGFVLDVIDSASAKVDEKTDDGAVQPTNPQKTGSAESLISWESIGRPGRNFISTGPTKEDISSFSKSEARDPIRVYIGLNARENDQEGAKLALAELKRVNAFDRSVLVITTPTGTGWMDSYAVDTIEYMYNGNTAITAMQYSYLQSPIALFVAPERPRETAQAIFHEIYGYWTTLPEDNRPKLYLNGVSLGSFGSESSFKMHEIIDDPINGALWAGPPFANSLWPDLVDERNSNTPAWLPTYKDGSFARFYGQDGYFEEPKNDWGSMRLMYLQHASDPISFFSPNMFYKKPEWLQGQRGPDISPLLHWYPGVTFFQLLFDLMVSVSGAPLGHGHNFSPIHYIDCWIAITDPPDWTSEKTERLKDIFSK